VDGRQPDVNGRRVVVTRPHGQAEELVAALRDAGADPVEIPMITIAMREKGIEELRSSLGNVEAIDWLVVTSPNGARVVRMLHEDGVPLPSVAALGEATAATLGHDVEFVATRAIGSVLVDEFPPGAGRVVLVQGTLAEATIAQGLEEKGWRVTRHDVYTTNDAILDDADATRVEGADAVVFASGSAVRNWVKHFGPSFGGVVVVIGPVTQRVAEEVGMDVAAVADEPTPAGIVRALAAVFSQ
jgi:uroporphyrinogen-III synthase